MTEPFPLDDAVSTTLDANGNGTVVIGPTRARQIWMVYNAACVVDSNDNEPEFRLYTGLVATPNQVAGTFSGSNDSMGLSVKLGRGNKLSGRWIGGDPGATATLSVYGEVQIQ